jgi:hypothetical protein
LEFESGKDCWNLNKKLEILCPTMDGITMLSMQFAKNNEASTLEQQVIVFHRKYQWVALFASLLFLWWGFVCFFIFKIENRYLYFNVG